MSEIEQVEARRQNISIAIYGVLFIALSVGYFMILRIPMRAIHPVQRTSQGSPPGYVLYRDFRVGFELPRGTAISHWVEYYQEGERIDLAKGVVVLGEETRNLLVSLRLEECADAQEIWSVSVGGETATTVLPKSPRGGRYEQTQTRRAEYGKPITVVVGVLSTNEIHTPFTDPFTDEGLLPWLDNPVVYVLKVQIDVPGK